MTDLFLAKASMCYAACVAAVTAWQDALKQIYVLLLLSAAIRYGRKKAADR